MQRRFFVPFATTALAVAVSACLPALSAAAEQQLDAVTIQADQPAVPADLPNTTAGITAKQIEESVNAVTAGEVLNYLPSVHVRERYIGDVNGVLVMRVNSSISSAQTTVYADGLLLSNFLNNSFSTAPRWGLVSPNEIDRVDVMYGPFSALFPGNSAGGVVEMTTHMPRRFEAHVALDAFTERFREYGTDGNFSGWHGNAAIGNRVGNWSFWLDGDHLDNRGHPMTFTAATAKSGAAAATGAFTPVSGARFDTDTSGNPRVTTASASIDHTVQDIGKIKLAYDFSPTVHANYTLGIWQNTSDKSGESYLRDSSNGNTIFGTGGPSSNNRYQFVRINGKDYTFQAPSTSRQEAESYLHGLNLKTDTGGTWDWQAIASYYDVTKDVTRTSSGNFGTTPSAAATAGTIAIADGTNWWNLDLRGDWRPGGDLKSTHQVSFGYHIDRYETKSDTFNLATGPWQSSAIGSLSLNSRGKTETEAWYLQDAWRVAPDLKWVIGGRAEHWRAFDGSNFASGTNVTYRDRDVNAFSPKMSLSWQASSDWALRGSIGKAYRFPTVGELFANIGLKHSDNSAVTNAAELASLPPPYNSAKTNDPSLRPERMTSSELALEHALPNGVMRVSVFYEDKHDALISQSDTTTLPGYIISSIQNVDKVRTRGVEAALDTAGFLLQGLDLNGSVTYADSIILRDAKNPLLEGTDQPRIPHWRATVVGTYHFNDRLSGSLSYRYSGHQHNALYDTVNHRYNDVNPDVYGAVSHYKVLDAKMLYRFDKQWSATLGINNVGNFKYYVNPNPYPQRTYFAGLKFDYL